MKIFLSRFFFLIPLVLLLSSCTRLTAYRTPLFHNNIVIDADIPRQFIEVLPSGKDIFNATLTAWTYEHGLWHKDLGPWPAVIGRQGFAPINAKREGDGMTPSGIYPLGTAFGKAKTLITGLPYRQATEDDIWIDDAASAQYNQWAKLPSKAASNEKMLRPDGLYDMGAVIEYNTAPVVPGHGSAIFIHIWRDNGKKPTAGCVALKASRLKHLLAWLKAEMAPAIALGTSTPSLRQ